MGLNLEQGSVNFQELDLKYKGGIGRDDASCAALALMRPVNAAAMIVVPMRFIVNSCL